MPPKSKRPASIKIGQVRASTTGRYRERDDRWYWRGRTTKTRLPVWTGWATRDEAEQLTIDAITKGLPSPSSHGGPADVRSVNDLIDAWVAAQRKREAAREIAPMSLYNYVNYASYWKEAVGDLLVNRMSLPKAKDTVTHWLADGVSPRTAQSAVDVLQMVYNWGEERGHCGRLSLKAAKPPTRSDEYTNCSATPTPLDAAAALRCLPPGPLCDLIHLLAMTGARVGELFPGALRGRHYDPATGILQLSGKNPELGRRGKHTVRAFPLPPEARAIIRRHHRRNAPDQPIFSDLPKDVADAARRALTKACKAAKVRRFTPHGLRRMVVMKFLDGGVDVKTISMLTGHSVAVLLRHYVRPTPTRLKDAVARAGVGTLAPQGTIVHADFG